MANKYLKKLAEMAMNDPNIKQTPQGQQGLNTYINTNPLQDNKKKSGGGKFLENVGKGYELIKKLPELADVTE